MTQASKVQNRDNEVHLQYYSVTRQSEEQHLKRVYLHIERAPIVSLLLLDDVQLRIV
jgi:hypothetical protein